MNNALGGIDLPLTVFGGNVPEVTSSAVPEGGSTGNQDCDFQIGSVLTRPGLLSVYSYSNQFQAKIPGSGANVLATEPSEVPWSSPNNITVNTPGTYASVTLNGLGGYSISSIIQVTFDPTKWNALGSPGTAPGDNGYDCANVWLDKDGVTFWAFEYFRRRLRPLSTI